MRRLLAGVAGLLILGAAAPAQAAVSPVEDLIAQCPSSAEVASLNADLAITFEGADPSGGTLVCHASDGSIDLTRFQERLSGPARHESDSSLTRASMDLAEPLRLVCLLNRRHPLPQRHPVELLL
jgi:hypothetical protein